jgi:hypothetical protein
MKRLENGNIAFYCAETPHKEVQKVIISLFFCGVFAHNPTKTPLLCLYRSYIYIYMEGYSFSLR